MATRKKKAAAKTKASTSKRKASAGKAPAAKRPAQPAPVRSRPSDPKAERFERILGVFNDSGLAELEYEDEELAMKVARFPTSAVLPSSQAPALPSVGAPPTAPPPASAPSPSAGLAAPEPAGQTVTSPFVGTFYRSPTPEAPPFTEVGQRVGKGQTLCIIEAMKLMNEIPSEYDGVVTKVLVNNGDVVQYGDGLFEIGPG